MFPPFVIGFAHLLLLALDRNWNQNSVFSRSSSLTLLISTPTPSLVKTILLRPPHFFASLPYPYHKLFLVPTTPIPVLLSPFPRCCNKLSLGAQLSPSIRCQRQCCNTVMSLLHTQHISKPRFRIPNSTIRKSRSRYIPGTGNKNTLMEKFSRFHLYWKVKPKGHLFTIVSIIIVNREIYFQLLLFSKAFDLNRAIATTSFKL